MKIFSAIQIKQGDAYTIEHEPISSHGLMERAAVRCARAVMERFIHHKNLLMLCGPGNNGGDGLAMARLLAPYFPHLKVFCFGNPEKRTADFIANFNRLRDMGVEPHVVAETDNFTAFQEAVSLPHTVIGDALFGTGLSKPITDAYWQNVIEAVNGSSHPVFSVDIPSGVFADSNEHWQNDACCIQADVTYTFEQPKLSFMFAENARFTGRVEVLPINIHTEFKEHTPATEFYITKAGISELRKEPPTFSHKGTFGHALLVGGSYGKAGSILLGANACMRSGAGLTTVAVPEKILPVIQNGAPEAMCIPAGADGYITEIPKLASHFSALGIGPGLGTDPDTATVLKKIIAEFNGHMVLDADALNILSENKTWLSFLPANSILTPHPKEFDRLTQTHESGYGRWKSQSEFSKKYNVYVILKGAHTSITTPFGKTFFNSTGNPGMATGGSGDVLTGILAGLLAQGYPAVDACLLGVFIHGLAGDFAFAQKGREALVASDIIDNLGHAFQSI